MKSIIETERTFLREFHVNDAENFYELNNDPEVMKYTGDLPFSSINESKDLIINYSSYQEYGYGRWTVIDKNTGEILGWCGLKYHPEEDYIDLGYRFHQRYWNNGYATETARACIDFGFGELSMNRIVGRTSKENIGSIKVLEKCGMKYWKDAPCEGIENSVYYTIEKSAYEV